MWYFLREEDGLNQRELRNLLLPEARAVNRIATAGLPAAEVEALKRILTRLRANLTAARGDGAADA